MDNKVNDLHYAVNFESHVKTKIIFLLSKTFFFINQLFFILGKVFSWVLRIKLPWHFFAKADTKKHSYASAKPSAFDDCRGEFQMLLDHIIDWWHCTTLIYVWKNLASTFNYLPTRSLSNSKLYSKHWSNV